MPYYNIGELEYDILTDYKGEQDEKLPDRIVRAVQIIKETDTKITFPWILQILKRHSTTPPWDQAYQNWVLLRKMFGKEDKDDEKNINPSDIFKTINATNQIQKLERSKQIQTYILKTAEAIQEIKVTHENLPDTLALICIIKGISLRFKNLDQGQINGLLTNWVVYCMTQIILSQTGKNREDNFAPIVDSIEKLTNSSILTRRIIPKTLIPKKKPRNKYVHFKSDIEAFSDDKKFNLENAIIQSTNIELEIKNAKDDFIEKLMHYEEERKRVTDLKKVEDEIYAALDEGRVLPYEPRFIEIFPLRYTEKLSWENYASQQNYYYFYIIQFIKKLIGYNESPHEVMKPHLEYIQREDKQLHTDYTLVQAANSEYQRLKKIKTKLNLDIKASKIAMNLQRQANSAVPQTENSPFFVDIMKKNKKTPTSWKRIFSTCFKILFWTGVGVSCGLGIGALIGAFAGAGIANIISIPLCMLLGGIVGFCAAGLYLYSTFEPPAPPAPFPKISITKTDEAPQNIYKKLKVQPEVKHQPFSAPSRDHEASEMHLDHKHSIPSQQISLTLTPKHR